MARRAARQEQEQEQAAGRNEVVLVGRVAAVPEERELPSGDLLAALRLVVDRPPATPRGPAGRTVSVDTLDCACWTAGVRRTARSLAAGDVVEVTGALRRRFWRAGAGSASRTEVEVVSLRRLARGPVLPRARPRRRTSGAARDDDAVGEAVGAEPASRAAVPRRPSGQASASRAAVPRRPGSSAPAAERVAARPRGEPEPVV